MSAEDYTLGSGKVYLGITGEDGERYVGNSPGLTLRPETRTIQSFGSRAGVVSPSESVVVGSVLSLSFRLDEITEDNMALFFGSEMVSQIHPALANQEETRTVFPGRLYKLGVLPTRPEGVRAVISLQAFIGVNEIDLALNFDVNPNAGIVVVRDNAQDIYPGQAIIFRYDVGATTTPVLGRMSSPYRGGFRYVEDNKAGINRIFYFPDTLVVADGDLDLKTDGWRELEFRAEISSSNQDPLYLLNQLLVNSFAYPVDGSEPEDYGNLSTTPPTFPDDHGVI